MIDYPKPKYRTTEVLINDKFTKFEFENIKKDMIFRMFEQDGTKVIGDTGCSVFRALKNVQYNKKIPYIEIIEVKL